MARKRTLLPNALKYSAGFTLVLFCKYLNPKHSPSEFPHKFTGREEKDVFKEARKQGWMTHKDRTATCPKCAVHRNKFPKKATGDCLNNFTHHWPEGRGKGQCAFCGITRKEVEKKRKEKNGQPSGSISKQ